MLTPAQAEELIGQHLQCLPIESLPLAQCAGAVLRENIYAERDAPPFDRVSMDGIALDSSAVSGGVRKSAHPGDAGRGRFATGAGIAHRLHRSHDRRGTSDGM